MSDTGYEGASGASESGSTDSPSGHSAGADQAIKSVKDTAYDAIVRSETLSTEDFVDETRDREAEERGEELPTHRKKARSERLQRALEEATRAVPEHAEHREAPTEHAPEASPDWESQVRARDDSIRKVTQFQMREAEYAKSDPDYYTMKEAILSTWPLQDHAAEVILGLPNGPQVLGLFVNNPNPEADGVAALEYINSLPPALAEREILQLAGRLQGRMEMQGQQQPARRVTQAKAPIKPLNGGAGPSTSWSDSNDMDTFAKGLNKDLASRRGRR
jgi:hypothetical protein